MDSQQPRRTSSAFEYFLYAAIVTETGLAAIIYKVIFGSGELAHMRYYFAIFYFAFLAWAIAQLHMLHRDRKAQAAESTTAAQGPEPQPAANEGTRTLLGLTTGQLVIVVVVFATAVATFSWALRLLP